MTQQQPGQPGQSAPRYSADGRWWWDGHRWVAVQQAQQQQPARSRRPVSVRMLLIAGGVALVVVIALAIALGNQPAPAGARTASAPTSAPQSTPTPTPAAAPVADPGREICQVNAAGGTYYRLDISETEHDLRACAGQQRFSGTIDDLLNLPGMDRRCIVASNAAIARNHATVGVYSDTKPADVAAARAYCQAEGETADGS